MNRRHLLLIALLLVSTVLVGVLPRSVEAETVLKTGGSGFSLGLIKILAGAYEKSHPGVSITIVPSLGSSGGIKAVLTGALDFALSGRPLNDEEKRQGGAAMEFARTPFVFVVNNKVDKQDITTRELEMIYAGRMTSWPGGAPLRLVLRPEGDLDTKILTGLSPAMEQALKSARAREGMIMALTDQDAAGSVEKINGALGGSTLTQIITEQRQVKLLSFNGVRPSVKGISNGSYPLAKNLYLVTSPKTPAEARRFIGFIGSKGGRKIIARYGNLPVEAGRDRTP